MMLGPYDPEGSSGIPTVRLDNDTEAPRMLIPIYYIHSLEHPFCRDFACECHLHQRQIAHLLGLVYEGELTLREALYSEEGKTL
jgi:hypothetical protein